MLAWKRRTPWLCVCWAWCRSQGNVRTWCCLCSCLLVFWCWWHLLPLCACSMVHSCQWRARWPDRYVDGAARAVGGWVTCDISYSYQLYLAWCTSHSHLWPRFHSLWTTIFWFTWCFCCFLCESIHRSPCIRDFILTYAFVSFQTLIFDPVLSSVKLDCCCFKPNKHLIYLEISNCINQQSGKMI